MKDRTGLDKGEQYSVALNEFLVKEKTRRSHVAFIGTARRKMDDFGLEEDLETYNNILDVFPRGRFPPIRMLDSFWPKATPQMELCLEVITKIKEKEVRPSLVTYDFIKAVFGQTGPLEKCTNIMYFFDKYRYNDPYEIRAKLPTNPVELSRLSLQDWRRELSTITSAGNDFVCVCVCVCVCLVEGVDNACI